MTKIVTISRGSLPKLAEAVRRLNTLPPQGPQGSSGQQIGLWYWAKLTSNLNAPTDGMASPTTATFDIWLPNGLTDPPGVTLIRSTDANQQGLTLYNRSQGLSSVSGTILQVEFAWGEWTIKWIDC